MSEKKFWLESFFFLVYFYSFMYYNETATTCWMLRGSKSLKVEILIDCFFWFSLFDEFFFIESINMLSKFVTSSPFWSQLRRKKKITVWNIVFAQHKKKNFFHLSIGLFLWTFPPSFQRNSAEGKKIS